MADFGAIEKIIQITLDNSLKGDIESIRNILLTFIIFCVLNIGALIANWVLQLKLKNKDFKLINHNLRENERMKIIQELYILLEDLTYYLNPSEKNDYLQKTQNINKYITKNKLYIDKDFQKISKKFTDYFLNVLKDLRHKSYEKEISILDEFIEKFNK